MIPNLPKQIICFLGPFGSGCSTTAKILHSRYNYGYTSLSEYIKLNYPNLTRREQQKKGNELRHEHGDAFLVEEALKNITRNDSPVLIDSIKHLGELLCIRNKYPNSITFGLFAEPLTRWDRLLEKYILDNKTFSDFKDDDEHDHNDEDIHGQQVYECTMQSDVLIDTTKKSKEEVVRDVMTFINLFYKPEKEWRPPEKDELAMSYAISVSYLSKCLKRQVGAIIMNKDGEILSNGVNNPPKKAEHSCYESGKCQRDVYRTCAKCDSKIKYYKCENCGDEKEDLKEFANMLDLCNSLHAEENAILNLTKRTGYEKGLRIFTTTFPCLLCAKKIAQLEFKEVIYVDPYPVLPALELMNKIGVEVTRYTGVMPRAFNQIFNRPVGFKGLDRTQEEKNEPEIFSDRSQGTVKSTERPEGDGSGTV